MEFNLSQHYLIMPQAASVTREPDCKPEWSFKTMEAPIYVPLCRQCHYGKLYKGKYYCHNPYWNWGVFGKPVDPDGFCAWGKSRKEK